MTHRIRRLAWGSILGPLLAFAPAAAEPLSLRGDVVARGDALTLSDLVAGATGPEATRPLFRSPSLGQTGTIQTRRIVQAALDLGLGDLETGGRSQVVVTRIARRIGPSEIEVAVKQALEKQHLVPEGAAMSIVFDGNPALVVPPDLGGPAVADEVVYDRDSRRLTALISVGSKPGERRSSLRVAGASVEAVEVAVLTRSLARGETVQPGDVVTERRPKNAASSEAQVDGLRIEGRVARRALAAGTAVRSGDLARPELVTRGESVVVVYEVPGLSLTVRGRAADSGALGDSIGILNPQSKRTLQATVVGPGRAAASTLLSGSARPGAVADASAARP